MVATGYLDASAAAALRLAVGGGGTEAAAAAETEFWRSVRSNPTVAAYEAYLEEYPNGAYAVLARLGVAELRRGGSDPPRPRPVVDAPGGRRDGEVFRDCAACPPMVVVPAGTFTMGSDPRDDESELDERPRHRVEVGRFALAQYEVTRGEYAEFVAATGHATDGGCFIQRAERTDAGGLRAVWRRSVTASWREPGFAQGDGHSAVCVSWLDAGAYVRWLSGRTGETYRLPSEAEWEYAARAGTVTKRYWGDGSDGQCGYANGADDAWERSMEGDNWLVADCGDGAARTAPTGSYTPNQFGLYDMLGNVWEWVEDCWHENYARAPGDGTAWTSGGDCGLRVLRGGSWHNAPRHLRSANRFGLTAGIRYDARGFRVSRTLD